MAPDSSSFPQFFPTPLAGAALLLLCNAVFGAEIQTGNPSLSVRWDTTAKYSLSSRVKSADRVLLGADNANGDDSDRNFSKGIVSNRIDLFTEADLVWEQRFGARMSGAMYYDDVYNKKNDNPGPAGAAFPNGMSAPYNEFTKRTRKRMGRNAELLDAFVFGKHEAGGVPVTFRLGQHGLVWGESLYFGGNALAGGMVPVDAIKIASVPGTQFKEAVRPVPMLSGTAQLTPQVSVGAYYQFRWRKAVIPAAGSYLSTSDILDEGGESLLLGALGSATRMADKKPAKGGQFGLQLRFRGDATDYGMYLIRFHEKTAHPVIALGLRPNPGPGPASVVAPAGYYLAYNQDVSAVALSASRSLGLFNIAMEAGLRHNASLASQATDSSALRAAAPNNVTDDPAYAAGRTAHLNVSVVATLDDSPFWREATLTGEVAFNRVLSISKNAAARDPNATRDGSAMRVVLEPMYRGVFPAVDLSIPMGFSWAPKGSRPMAVNLPQAWVPENGGDISLGLNASYRDAWRLTASYIHYHGEHAPVIGNGSYLWQQSLGSRDFISASIRYSF